ncbi:MAG TPA: hypothetical protein VMH22_06570 [bacterium]|nr:hypothetical protein [bacterium]
MRKVRLLIVVASLMAPLFWSGTLQASDLSNTNRGNDVNLGSPGPGGGMAEVTEIPATVTESSVVTGRVVDANCWLSTGVQGESYRDSAIACARNGTPLAILTESGSLVYPLMVDADGNTKPDMDTLAPYAEHYVRVTGRLIQRGKERAIMVSGISAAPEPKKPGTFEVKETPGTEVDGRVVDLGAWIASGNKGTADAKIVQACSVGGDPLVVVTKAGRIYYPVTKTMPSSPVGTSWLSKYCARQVRVTGATIARGEARGIVISSVDQSSSQ